MDAVSVLNSSVKKSSTAHQRVKGFTLLELLLVVIILAILAAIVFPSIFDSSDAAEVAAAQTILKQVNQRIEMARHKDGQWPAAIQPEWFSSLPKNPFVPNHQNTILDDNDSNPNKWQPQGKTTAAYPFWYNPAIGLLRIRVPAQASNAETLALYNLVNRTNASTLTDTSFSSNL